MPTLMNARPRFAWSLDWKSSLFTVLLLPVLLVLGVWQLERAAEKRTLQQQYAQAQAEAPVPLAELGEPPPNYRWLQVQGHFDAQRFFLLDNRTRQGRAGFEVIGLFRPEGSPRWLAVNRGWVAGSADRRLPVLQMPAGTISLRAQVYHPPADHRPSPAEAISSGDWPQVTQTLSVVDWQAVLGEPMYPFLVRLAADDLAALQAEWPLTASSADKHVGYALQWFLMALALVFLFVFRNSNLRACLCGRSPAPGESP